MMAVLFDNLPQSGILHVARWKDLGVILQQLFSLYFSSLQWRSGSAPDLLPCFCYVCEANHHVQLLLNSSPRRLRECVWIEKLVEKISTLQECCIRNPHWNVCHAVCLLLRSACAAEIRIILRLWATFDVCVCSVGNGVSTRTCKSATNVHRNWL